LVVYGGDLGAAFAGCSAFLGIPATFFTDHTWRKRVDSFRHHLDDARREAAFFAVEVRAFGFFTGRGEAENFGGLARGGHGENRFTHGQDLVEIHHGRVGLNDSEDTTILHLGLRAGTQFRHGRLLY